MRGVFRGMAALAVGAGRMLRRVPRRSVRYAVLVVLAGALVFGGVKATRAAWKARSVTQAIPKVEAKVVVGETSATVTLAFEVAGPGLFGEARVPVLPAGASLVEATLGGGEAELDLVNGGLAIVVTGSGRQSVELVYALPLPDERRLALALPRGIRTSVDIELPDAGMTVKAAAPAIVEMQPLAGKTPGMPTGKTVAKIITPPTDRLELSWHPTPESVESPVRTAARTETLYTIQGDSLTGRTVYRLRIDGRDVSRLAFEVADGVAVDHVEGAWIEGWDTSDGKLVVQAKEAVTGEVSFTLHHRRPIPDGEVDLGVPTLEGAVRQWGFGAVAAGGAVELKGLTLENGSEIDPRGLPEALRSAGAAAIARAFRYDGVPARQGLAIVRHEETETLEATADSLNALLVYTPDGRSVGKMVYWVRNVRRQHLAVELPEGAELWSVYVAGNPVRPSKSEDGKVLVPLSCSAATAKRAFPVELVYFVEGEAFADKGGFQARLPEVDVPVMQVMLSVSLPEEIALEDAGGNLRRVEAFAMSLAPQDVQIVRTANTARPADAAVQDANDQLDRALARGQRGNIRLRFDYQALEPNKVFQKAFTYNNDNRNYVQQYFVENGAQIGAPSMPTASLSLTNFGQAELAEITGLASLKVAVPPGGTLVRFERALLMNERPSVEADYWSNLAGEERAEDELRVDSTVHALYGLAPRGTRLAARLAYRVESGKLDALRYDIPAGAKVLSVEGTNLARWKVEDATLTLSLVRPERKGGSFVLRATLGDPPAGGETDAEAVTLAPPRLGLARSEELVVAVDAPSRYELRFVDAAGQEQLPPSALPAEITGPPAERTRPVVFRLRRGRTGVTVEATVHDEVAGLGATCDSVNAISFYTEEGVCVTRAIYEIRNVNRRHVAITLPEGARLWGAFVADRAVRALSGADGATLVPLERASRERTRSFPVEVVYTRSRAEFARRGRFEDELPTINVPVMHAMYSAYLPKRLRLRGFEGTLRRVKEFSAPVAPKAPLAERMPAANAATLRYSGNRLYQERQQALELNVSRRDVAKALGPAADASARTDGDPACALKIYIPAVGQLVRFERHLVVEGEMSVSCGYKS